MSRGALNRVLSFLHTDLLKDASMALNSSERSVSPEVRLAVTLRLLSRTAYHDLMMILR